MIKEQLKEAKKACRSMQNIKPEIKNKALRVTLFDGKILTNDWTNLIIDEEVFKNLPSEDHHKTYRLSIVKSE